MTDLDWSAVPEAERPAHLQRLNPEQFAAVTHRQGPLLILAGAGSGKTRVLTRRIAHLLHTGVDPASIFAVTFTNKAAAEMKERVAELVGEVGKDVWVSTFHSSCGRILRAEAEALGYTRRFSIYDDDDQLRILRQIIADLGYDKKVIQPTDILGRIDHHKNRMRRPDDLVTSHRASSGDPLLRIWRLYEESLAASDAMDFNDLIGNAVRLFSEHPEVLAKYQETFEFVMVDEYQDTNKSQYTLLRLLAGGHRNLAVVGDDDQSIYGFRGADISNILGFENDFPEATVVRMEQNYRCTDKILALANAVVAKNTDRIDKRLWTETTSTTKVHFLLADNPHEEAHKVAVAIKQLRRRGVKWSDVAVIYRTNATSQPFEAQFRDLHIPHKVVGGRPFYARREIRDALAFVRLLVNPNDDAAFLRVVNVPTRGIGAVTIAKLREEAGRRGAPLFKTTRSMSAGVDRASKAMSGFVKLIDGLTEVAASASLPATVQEILERSGYVQMLRDEDNRDARNRLDNLNQLLRDAAAFLPEEHQSPAEALHAWLDRIALSGSDEEIPEDGEVTLMTVHCSKGLEYPIVFVVQMVEGRFPHSRSAEEPGGVAEERRLVYVAFTRAQKRLIITRARIEQKMPSRDRHATAPQPVAPSRFLFGIPLEVCTGDLPREEGEEVVLDEVIPAKGLSNDQQAILRRIRARHEQRQHGGRSTPDAPPIDEEHTVVEIEDLSDLTPGVRVLHARFGAGTIIECSGSRIRIRFGARTRELPLHEGGLRLLRD